MNPKAKQTDQVDKPTQDELAEQRMRDEGCPHGVDKRPKLAVTSDKKK